MLAQRFELCILWLCKSEYQVSYLLIVMETIYSTSFSASENEIINKVTHTFKRDKAGSMNCNSDLISTTQGFEIEPEIQALKKIDV